MGQGQDEPGRPMGTLLHCFWQKMVVTGTTQREGNFMRESGIEKAETWKTGSGGRIKCSLVSRWAAGWMVVPFMTAGKP